jgi:glycine/D-amino acid oxidase-like deaminating enzyme
MTALSRRELLTAASLWMAGCAARRTVLTPPAPTSLARVRVAPERVIRTIVGLRPFRPSGFVVRGEKLNDKLLIHNYGHGGAGITLSWGTAQLAVTEAAPAETRVAAVIGCGVVGLSTARLLQQRGYAVTIYAKAIPPDTNRWPATPTACGGCRYIRCLAIPPTRRRRPKAPIARSIRFFPTPASFGRTSTASTCPTSTGATRC